MSILNVQDIEKDLEIVESSYAKAISEHGELGGKIWMAVGSAIEKVGLEMHMESNRYNIGMIPGPPTPTYNFDEIANEANQHLYENDICITIDFMNTIFGDGYMALDFKAKYYEVDWNHRGQYKQCAEISLYYIKNEGQQPLFGRMFR